MPSKKQEKITNEDLLAAINASFTSLETGLNGRFEGIDKRFEGIDKRFEKIDERFERVENRLSHIEWDVSNIKATMVTKEYLEQRLTAIA